MSALEGRVAIVTGASRGLGREIASALWGEGASLVLVGRHAADLQDLQRSLVDGRSAPPQAVYVRPADLSDPLVAERIIRETVDRLGRVDVLVNNAAITGPIGPLEACDWHEWTHALATDLLAPVALMRAAVPVMRLQGRGKIINLSGGGATGPRAHFTAYAAAKSALVRVTETVAEELRDTGIDVNAIAPGAMNTRMLDDVIEAGPAKVGSKVHEAALKQQAAGGASPARAAALCVFLASSTSDGISGRLISAMWDPWPTLPGRREELQGSDIYTLRRIVPEDRGKAWGEAS